MVTLLNIHCFSAQKLTSGINGEILPEDSLDISVSVEEYYWYLFTHNVTAQILALCTNYVNSEYNEAVHQLFIDFKKAYDSVRREVLYNILIEFGISKKLVRLIIMCLTEMYSRVRVG